MQASLAKHMADRARTGSREHTAAAFDRRCRQAEQSAGVLEGLLFERAVPETSGSEAEEELSSS